MSSHSHCAQGSFYFESDGVAWAADLGMQNYNSLESRGVDLWNMKQAGQRWEVFRIGPWSHNILTLDNRVVILPNGALSNGKIINYNGRPLRRVEWLVSVEYGVDAQACKSTILEMVNADPRVLQEDTDMAQLYKELQVKSFQLSTVNYQLDAIPAPFVALKSLNANDITFVVRAWVRADDFWGVFFDLQEQFYTELPKRGFGFAYPHVVVKQ